METWLKTVALTLAASALIAGVACGGGETIKAPVSDDQFDDPDEPGGGVPIGAVDASTLDALADAPVPVSCTSSQECPTGEVCLFPTSVGCTVTTGQCTEFLVTPNCVELPVCACPNTVVPECVPSGFGSVPNQPSSACADSSPDSGGI